MSKQNYVIPIFVPHKGCPHNCIFCNQKRITGQNVEMQSEDIDVLINKYLDTIGKGKKNIEVAFYGGSFTAIPINEQNIYLNAAYKYLEKGKINAVRLSTRPDYIDIDILQNLKKHGVSIVELGVQSMDEEVLSVSQRGHSAKDTLEAIELLKDEGFTVGVQLMVGLPMDSEEKCIETVKKVVRLKPHIARIYPALVIKDTYMEYLYKTGKYTPFRLNRAVEICKTMLIILERNLINVIRIGLQPTAEMQLGKNIIDGPYHPSFRQLVVSELYKDMIECILVKEPVKSAASVKILFNERDYSDIIGQNKSNVKYFKNKYSNKSFEFLSESINRNAICVSIDMGKFSLSKDEYYRNQNAYSNETK